MLASFALAATLASAPLKDILLTDQPTHAVHLKVGQKLVFAVFGNATTGAQWSVKSTGAPGLESLGVTNAPEPPQKAKKVPMVGQGSNYLITFKGLKKGTFNVKAVYGRGWELSKGAKPWDQRTAKVIVQ